MFLFPLLSPCCFPYYLHPRHTGVQADELPSHRSTLPYFGLGFGLGFYWSSVLQPPTPRPPAASASSAAAASVATSSAAAMAGGKVDFESCPCATCGAKVHPRLENISTTQWSKKRWERKCHSCTRKKFSKPKPTSKKKRKMTVRYSEEAVEKNGTLRLFHHGIIGIGKIYAFVRQFPC